MGNGMQKNNLIYKNDFTQVTITTIAKTAGFYIAIFAYWLFLANSYMSFGRKLVIPMVSMMWLAAAITVFFIKEQRENTIKETKWWLLAVLGFLTILRAVNYFMTSSSDHTMTTAGELAMTQMLQNILNIITIMAPLAHLIWCGTKFRIFHGKNTKKEAFDRIKNMRT